MPDLDPAGTPVELHPRLVIRTPGLSGTAQVHPAASPGTRAADASRPELLEALRTNGMTEDLTVEIRQPREERSGTGSRAVAGGDAIRLDVAEPGPAFGQVVLYVSEDGAMTWHLPERSAGGSGARGPGGGGTAVYRIPRLVTPAPAAPGQRGLAGAIGKKVLKILTFRLVKEGSRWVGQRFATQLEDARRPHRLSLVSPGPGGPTLAELPDDLLRSWAGERALLLVHGTFSSTRGGFGAFRPATLQELHQRYGERVVAFDHPTISRSPVENAQWLAGYLKDRGARMDVDLITHSRGGLVGRVLAEASDLGGTAEAVRVHRAAFVACPHAGTRLADVQHHSQLIDRFTNLLQFVPSNGVTDALEVVLAVLKQVATGVVEGLPGLTSMDPRGPFLTERLNVGAAHEATYFAAGSNFEPAAGSPFAQVAIDHGADLVFGGTDNDLVVPREGAHTVTGPHGFSIADPVLFESSSAVHHSGYWAQDRMNQALLGWLSAPAVSRSG